MKSLPTLSVFSLWVVAECAVFKEQQNKSVYFTFYAYTLDFPESNPLLISSHTTQQISLEIDSLVFQVTETTYFSVPVHPHNYSSEH